MPFKPTLILSRAQLLPWSWAGTGISPILSSSCKQTMGQTLNLKLNCAECSFWCFLSFSVKSYHHSTLLYWQHCSTDARRVHDTYKQLIRKYHSLVPMSTCSNLHTASSLSKTLRPCRLEKVPRPSAGFAHPVSRSGITNWLFWVWSRVLRVHLDLGLGTWPGGAH